MAGQIISQKVVWGSWQTLLSLSKHQIFQSSMAEAQTCYLLSSCLSGLGASVEVRRAPLPLTQTLDSQAPGFGKGDFLHVQMEILR